MNADPGLTPEQRRELADAKERSRAFMGAVRTATFNIWTIGSFAAITILFGLFSLTALVLGIGMAVVTWNEYRGRAMVRRFEPEGPRLLGRNQLGLMVLIIAYALWSMYQTTANPDPELAQMDQILGGDTAGLVAELTIYVYVGVIAVTGVFQGMVARYYFKRIAMLEAYVRDTPAWVLDMQRAASLD
ncbi:MAG TPA: hypothetical protein VJ997_11845 [Longimicrobiales bacterium]|nr:hypothetical protein [Longimicrobiales bacterium]